MPYLFAFWLMCAFAGGFIAHHRADRLGLGFVLGFLLGPIGIACCFAITPSPKTTAGSRALYAAPTPPTSAEGFCLRCGVDAVSQIEMGATIYLCPKCGSKC